MAPQQDVISKSRGSRAWFYIALASLVAAVGTHGYLTNYHFTLKYGAPAADSLCTLSAVFSCDAAAASKYAELFGIPLALWGAIANFILLGLAVFFPLTDESRKPAARANLLAFSGFIALTSVVMGIISVTQLTRYCPFCIATYVFSFLAFAGFWFGLPKYGKTPFSLSDGKSLVISGAIILAGAFVLNSGLRRPYVGDPKQFERMIGAYLREWNANPQVDIEAVSPLVKGDGGTGAKMTIVEFADFRCGHCKTAAPALDAFVKAHPDTRLLFHTWPLDAECNSAIQHSNGASCALARAVLCAEKKDRGWQAHDWVFERQEQFGSLDSVMTQMPEMSKDVGLDWDEIKTCMDSEETKKTVRDQAELGKRLNIQGTPSIFVNGRQLPGGQALPVLRAAYEQIVNN